MLNAIPTISQINRELAIRSLSEYTRQAWHVVEPATEYIHGWHIDAICEHLEAATRGEIRNLIINIPPRHMKSLLCCVMWPTWVWTFRPDTRWLFSSYGANLSIRDSLKCRRIIQSNWYQKNFGESFYLLEDQNQKIRFENSKQGFRVATGVGGMGTGEGGDFIVSDDPLKAGDADSDTAVNTVNEWWDQTMSTRGNNPKTFVRLVVMQRLIENDLTGYVLDKMKDGGVQYEHLCIPAEYEPGRCQLTTGWTDPRTEEGELLWPERFDAESLENIKRALGPDATAGQLQQRPSPAGGAIFKSEWWSIEENRNRYDYTDSLIRKKAIARWHFWDTALKDKESNDFSALTEFELWPDYTVAVRQQFFAKIEGAFLPDKIEEMAIRSNVDEKLRAVVIEDKQSGTTAIQTLRATSPEWLANIIYEFQPHGTKEYRARQASIWCSRDCIKIPLPVEDIADWYFEMFDSSEGQLFKFPNSKNDDLTDSFVMGILYLENYLSEGWHARNGHNSAD